MKVNPSLKRFLKPYDKNIQKLTFDLRNFIVDTVPEANELIWDNYNAVALAYSKSKKLKDAFCHIAVYSKHVNFGFNRGVELINPLIDLNGKGKLIRHISIRSFESFPTKEIEKMIYEAVGIAEERNPILKQAIIKPASIIMSIAKKKIRPRSLNLYKNNLLVYLASIFFSLLFHISPNLSAPLLPYNNPNHFPKLD